MQEPDLAEQHKHLFEVSEPTPSEFLHLPPQEQSGWLWNEKKWNRIASAEMVPTLLAVIESIADDSSFGTPGSGNLHRDRALLRLHELQPEQARKLLIEEIQRPGTIIVDADLLAILPPGPLPELDEALAKNLEGEHVFTAASFIERFASPAIYQRIKNVYLQRAGPWDCMTGADLLAYLVRANASDAIPLFTEVLDRRVTVGCHQMWLCRIAKSSFGPSLEALLIARLNDPAPETALAAASALRGHGSENARKHLWQRLESWYEEWKGRSDELHPHPITGADPNRG